MLNDGGDKDKAYNFHDSVESGECYDLLAFQQLDMGYTTEEEDDGIGWVDTLEIAVTPFKLITGEIDVSTGRGNLLLIHLFLFINTF